MKINLALNLPQDIQARALELSRQLARQSEAYFVLGEENHLHVTLYAVEFPDSMTQEVFDVTQQIACDTEPLLCTVKGVETHQGYIGVELDTSAAIRSLHQRVVYALAPLRAQAGESSTDYNMMFTPEQIANIERYGYADALQLYNPHFTLVRLKNEGQAKKIIPDLRWDISTFIVRSIGVYTMGDHGTCKELLADFLL
jgi:2'-5' RNA ligase